MKLSDITTRKIGAFEVLVALILPVAILPTGLVVTLILLLAITFFFAKKHFGGEFSLAQLRGLSVSEKKDQEKPST